MATASDAELILKLYEVRREDVMRKARSYMGFEFNPDTLEELFTITRAMGTDPNTYWRQVTSYWEMAAAMVLRGALDPDLFFDSNGEPFFLLAKVDHLRDAYQKVTGNIYMRHTAELIAKYPAAEKRYNMAVKGMQARRAAAAKA